MASFSSLTYGACALFPNSLGTNRFIRPLNDLAAAFHLSNPIEVARQSPSADWSRRLAPGSDAPGNKQFCPAVLLPDRINHVGTFRESV
jgi:hypothetical protein